MQKIYIDQLFDNHQINNCNLVFTLMIKKLCPTPAHDNFNFNPKDILTYKQFAKSV